MLDVQNLTKKYKNDSILNDVSFRLASGEALLLLGDNGSGKTTLLLSVSGLLPIESGDISLDGRSVLREFSKLRGKISYVSQDPSLLNGLSVKDNLRYWSGISGLSKTLAKQQTQWLVEALGLEPFLHKKISRLSGGMKKRVNLAVSLFSTPRLLLLDEPFANVDRDTKSSIYSLLALYRKSGCCIILVSHIDDEASRFADRCLTLQDGRLLGDLT